jgi:hypothetical protein
MHLERVLEHRGKSVVSLAALLCVAAGCGGSDDATPADSASAEVVTTSAAEAEVAETASLETEAAETEAAPGTGLGNATVTFGDEVHRFAILPEYALDGECDVVFGVLVIDLPLVESNGVAAEPGNGWLRMDIEMEDVADFEPYAEMRVAGGHWYAGASETASISGVETPEITLAASGLSVTGAQTMVPIVAGPGEPIEAMVEATCE